MAFIKSSLICTVLNEENTIEKFVDSIAKQSVLPSEVIIVDGKSKDATVLELKRLKKKYPNLSIKLFIKKGNRSVGRNFGIRKAASEIILLSDSGCILDKNWIKEIIKPFNDRKTEVVAGYYKGESKNVFQKSLTPYVLVMEDKVNVNNFLPATRSMAIRKSVWRRLRGFDEELSHNEDYAFANKITKEHIKISFAKNAIVRWIPRKNIYQAFKMFFRFALGDAQARIYREKVIYIFLRYLFAFYLLSLAVVMKSILLNIFIIIGILSYLAWSVKKNYKYVDDKKAYFYLPLLQIASDLAVIFGTASGFIQNLSIENLLKTVTNNKFLVLIIFFYSVLILSLIQWGIPNLNHPFNYAMDEWHFSQALRTFIKDGTGSVSGAASIPLYHIVSSILFLIPFYVLHIINPLAIKYTLDNLPMQHTLFEILRLHTLFYGILSIIVVYKILKSFLNKFALIFTAIFVFNPIFISLTNYYKYDVTLIFWILTSLYLLHKYFKTQTISNFIFGGISVGLALSTKFTAAPLFVAYLLGYFILTNKPKFKEMLFGALISLFVFIFIGIPDLILGKGNYYQLLYSTLIQGPVASASFNLGYPSWFFIIFKEFPSIFGIFLTYLFYGSIIFWLYILLLNIAKREIKELKFELLVVLTGLFFLLSTISFNVDGGGNRALVLLPFMILLPALLINKFLQKKDFKKIIYFLLILAILVQVVQSLSWISVKFFPDPRQTSSFWIQNNIPKGSSIGIENIPIYQMLPDFVLKEFYSYQHDNNLQTRYKYTVISSDNKTLPKYVIISNDFNNVNYLKNSPKKDLVYKLKENGYRKIKEFTPQLKYYNLFADRLYFMLANIIPAPVNISIYEK